MIDLSKMTVNDRDRYFTKVDTGTGIGTWDRCWGWRGSHKRKGYARFWFQGHTVAAHRVAYFLMYGKLPAHLEIDHVCRKQDHGSGVMNLYIERDSHGVVVL